MNTKPKLPSIRDLLEGGPGLIDYTIPPMKLQHYQYHHHKHLHRSIHHGHRRHASEHIISNHNRLLPPHPYSTPCLKTPPSMSKPSALSPPMIMQISSIDRKNMRARTHSRSYSDFIYPAALQQKEEQEEEEEEEEEEEGEEKDVSVGRSTSSCRYTCPYCNKGFTRPSSLRTHTFSHTGEKPFVCAEPCCGRKFSVQSNLRRHLRIHRSNKPTTVFLAKNIK